jgi:hypothetical protein
MAVAPVALAAAAVHPDAPSDRVGVHAFVLRWEVGSGGRQLRDLFEQAGDDPTELWQIAMQSLRLEEVVATGCLLVQAVALVRLWTKQHGVEAVAFEHEAPLTRWRTSRAPRQRSSQHAIVSSLTRVSFEYVCAPVVQCASGGVPPW